MQISICIIIVIVLLILWRTTDSHSIYDRYVYFDYNGTTPPFKETLETLKAHSKLGNAHASYALEAKITLDSASKYVGDVLGGNLGVIWTSGGSEANNLFIRGVVDQHWLTYKTKPHIIVSQVEHKTTLDCIAILGKLERAEVTLLPVLANTSVCPYVLARAIKDTTILVSIMHVNNESGAINKPETIGAVVAVANKDRTIPVLYHSDCVQSMGKIPPNMNKNGMDALSFSSHKFGGITGVGALVISQRVVGRITSEISGTQNHGLRGGTDNIAGIAATITALKISLHDRQKKNLRMFAMKKMVGLNLLNYFGSGNLSAYLGKPDDFELPGSPNTCEIVPIGPLPPCQGIYNTLWMSVVKRGPIDKHFCNLQLRDSLQKRGVIISVGSACTSDQQGSHVLMAIGAPYIIRCGVFRISLGDHTTESQCKKLFKEMVSAIREQLD